MTPPDPTATLPEDSTLTPSATASPPGALALSIAWAADAPERVGEVALLTSAPRILGRGEASPDDPLPRLAFVRERGGAIEPCPSLASPQVSRIQLRARARDDGGVEVENVGRLRLLHRGAEVSSITLHEGDVIEVGAQLLLLVVRRALAPTEPLRIAFPFGDADPAGIVGESSAAWALRSRIAFVAASDRHVLVRGASGTGKELVARALHARSARAGGPLVARSAATFPEALIDAELFGHARNYPNAGMPERPGLIAEADGGTLFLDEIAELPQAMQAHLLRVLDDGEYQRLGEARARRSSFRLVAATNRPPSALKHDVLARLVQQIEVPGLEERREDIPLIVRHILRRVAASDASLGQRWIDEQGHPRLSAAFVRAVVEHPYTTNVRELEALVWRSLETSRGERLDPPPPAGPKTAGPPPTDDASSLSAARIQACLDEHNGVMEAAWRPLGLPSRHALARLVKKHKLEIRRRPR